MLGWEQIAKANELRGPQRFRATPLHYPASLNARIPTAAEVFLKLELFQRTGSFKVRGATARVHALTPQERKRGIIAASAGNHAQGVALAAASHGVAARVVMPEYAPLTKREATKGYGAEVILHGATFDESTEYAMAMAAAENAVFIHAFDDEAVMAGQGTVGIELIDEMPDLGAVVCPVGGGGLISGVAVALKHKRPDVKVIGVQAAGADSAVRSFVEGRRMPSGPVDTIADGIKVAHVGSHTFDVIHRYVDEMITVDDVAICRAMLALDEHAHLSAEPAGAIAVAALLEGGVDVGAGPVVAIITGGNIDTFEKTRYIRRALAEAGRHLRLQVRLRDRRGSKPREMAEIFSLLAEHEINILDIDYQRDRPGLPLGVVLVEFLLETRGGEFADALEASLIAAGFEISRN
jgi:threonine dehydratase